MTLKRTLDIFIILSLLVFSFDIQSHGFAENTFISMGKNDSILSINQLIYAIRKGKRRRIRTYNSSSRCFAEKRVRAAGASETSCYCTLSFDDEKLHNVVCTPSQCFYRISDGLWVEAYLLKKGDRLLCDNNQTIVLQTIRLTLQPLAVYTLEVKKTHTFLVGFYGLVTHNMLVPVAAIGCSVPFSAGYGSAFIGIFLGPAGLIGGAVLGGALGYIVHLCMKERFSEYTLSFKTSHIASLMKSNEANSKNNGESSINGGSFGGAPQEDPDDNDKYPYGKYKDAPYHHRNSTGGKSPAPIDGQAALNNSLRIKDSSPHRIGISNNQFIVLRETNSGVFHGYVCEWTQLTDTMQKILRKSNLVSHSGKILCK